MPRSHALLAVAIVAIWGSNFVVIRDALRVWPPLWLAVLRFALALAPLLLLAFPGRLRDAFRPPAAGWRNVLAYGVLIGAGQFGLLFSAMKGHIAPGLASLVIQSQVFITIGLAMLLERERPRAVQGLALAVALAGIGLIAWHAHDAAGSAGTTPLGLGLVLAAAASWALGNIVGRRARGAAPLAYVVWSSFGAVPVLVALALGLEGWPAFVHAWHEAGPRSWAAVAWQSFGNTLFGYGAWSWLMQRHPAATVTPWALLVPVFGLGSAALVLGEPLQPWKLGAAALVIAGLALNMAPALLKRR